MKYLSLSVLFVFAVVLLTGCSGAVKDFTEGQVRVDPKNPKNIVNRNSGITVKDYGDYEVTMSSIEDMKSTDQESSTQKTQVKEEIVTENSQFESNATKLINKKGYLRGTIANQSTKMVTFKIYRKTNGEYKEILTQVLSPMSLKTPFIPFGEYFACVEVEKKRFEHWFEVRKDEKNNAQILVYYKKSRKFERLDYEGYWFLVYNELNKLEIDE